MKKRLSHTTYICVALVALITFGRVAKRDAFASSLRRTARRAAARQNGYKRKPSRRAELHADIPRLQRYGDGIINELRKPINYVYALTSGIFTLTNGVSTSMQNDVKAGEMARPAPDTALDFFVYNVGNLDEGFWLALAGSAFTIDFFTNKHNDILPRTRILLEKNAPDVVIKWMHRIQSNERNQLLVGSILGGISLTAVEHLTSGIPMGGLVPYGEWADVPAGLVGAATFFALSAINLEIRRIDWSKLTTKVSELVSLLTPVTRTPQRDHNQI